MSLFNRTCLRLIGESGLIEFLLLFFFFNCRDSVEGDVREVFVSDASCGGELDNFYGYVSMSA